MPEKMEAIRREATKQAAKRKQRKNDAIREEMKRWPKTMSTTDLEAPDDTAQAASAAANPLAQFVQVPRGAALDAYWMPFTANRQFKSAPRLVSRAEGMYYYTPEGRQVMDAQAGLW